MLWGDYLSSTYIDGTGLLTDLHFAAGVHPGYCGDREGSHLHEKIGLECGGDGTYVLVRQSSDRLTGE